MSIIDTLVTDRTRVDVDAGNPKGTYTASDLNRVGAAMNYVADRLREQGYDPHISPRTDWADSDWVTPADQAVYLGDLAELRRQLVLLESTPQVPPRILATGIRSRDGLTPEWANDIEQILVDIDMLLTSLRKSMLYSAQPLLYCGFAVYMAVAPQEQAEITYEIIDGNLYMIIPAVQDVSAIPTMEINLETGELSAAYPEGYAGHTFSVDDGYLIVNKED